MCSWSECPACCAKGLHHWDKVQQQQQQQRIVKLTDLLILGTENSKRIYFSVCPSFMNVTTTFIKSCCLIVLSITQKCFQVASHLADSMFLYISKRQICNLRITAYTSPFPLDRPSLISFNWVQFPKEGSQANLWFCRTQLCVGIDEVQQYLLLFYICK